jgi:hypothetical protein
MDLAKRLRADLEGHGHQVWATAFIALDEARARARGVNQENRNR